MNEQTARIATALGVGLALGQILVWILETFYLAEAIPSEVAIAMGNVLAAVVHVCVRIVQRLLPRRKEHDSSDDDHTGGAGSTGRAHDVG